MTLSKDYADFSTRYGPEHPKMKALQVQMDEVRKAYDKEMSQVLLTFEKAYEEIVDNEKALRSLMEQQKNEAIELSKIEIEYRPLMRASQQDDKMYSLISSRQKEIDITGPMRTNNVRVLERAIVPGAPIRPKPIQNLMLGLLLGLGTGVGLAFAIEALDNTLKTQADVEQFLGVPVLGLVPVIGTAQEPSEAVSDDLPWRRSAAVRFARTSCSCRRIAPSARWSSRARA